MTTGAIICSFSGAIDQMPRADQRDDRKVLAVLAKHPRFSAFDATANMGIAKTLVRLANRGYIEYPDPQPGYPWCVVIVTPAGKAFMENRDGR